MTMAPGGKVMRGLEIVHIADLILRHELGVKYFQCITDPGDAASSAPVSNNLYMVTVS